MAHHSAGLKRLLEDIIIMIHQLLSFSHCSFAAHFSHLRECRQNDDS